MSTGTDPKNGEKITGIYSKVKIKYSCDGVFNIPTYLRGKNDFGIKYKFQISLLGKTLKGGKFF